MCRPSPARRTPSKSSWLAISASFWDSSCPRCGPWQLVFRLFRTHRVSLAIVLITLPATTRRVLLVADQTGTFGILTAYNMANPAIADRTVLEISSPTLVEVKVEIDGETMAYRGIRVEDPKTLTLNGKKLQELSRCCSRAGARALGASAGVERDQLTRRPGHLRSGSSMAAMKAHLGAK